jgi:hypothetical protein
VRAMRTALDSRAPGPRPDRAAIEAALGTISTGAQAQLQGRLDRLAGAAPGATLNRGSHRRPARARITD